MNEVSVTYSRSSGPGGQNVNKLDTKVDLRFHVESSKWIPEAVRERMLTKVIKRYHMIIFLLASAHLFTCNFSLVQKSNKQRWILRCEK